MGNITLNNGTKIGINEKPYFIAEVNTSHFGSVEKAKKLADEVKQSGADCIKFQSWSAESLYSEQYYRENPIAKRFVKKFAFNESELLELSRYCKEISLDFSSTPYSKNEADFLINHCKAPFIKVASMDINNLDYLRYIAKLDTAVIISSGMATFEEIEVAVDTLMSSGCSNLVIFHCVSIYPSDPKLINLKNILKLEKAFPQCAIGYSDHTLGIDIGAASVLYGACVIEKHFTLDSSIIGMDNQMAIEAEELGDMIKSIERIYHSRGGEDRVLSKDEIDQRFKMRRSLVFTRDLSPGEVIARTDIEGLRPGTGIPISQFDDFIGKKVIKEVKKGYLVNKSDFAIDDI